ncbi:MAG: hypothetical protein AAF804_05685 [Bacteroidota bacterium]
MNQIEKSSEARQKELHIEKLEIAIKKKRATIKGLRTRLGNLKQNIRDMSQKMNSTAMSSIERLKQIQAGMIEALERLLKQKKIKLKASQREVAQGILAEIRGDFDQDGQEMIDEAWEQINGAPEGHDYEEEARSADAFAEFRPEPSAEEKRDIRKVYLKLSQAFHPDMARTDQDRELYHKRMQQISAAYQQHDIEALLQMEQQFLGDQFEDDEVIGGTNLLDDKIARLERELDFLDSQAGRLSVEIKEIRQSGMGQALTEYDRGNRNGYGLDQQAKEMNQSLDGMQETLDILEEALQKGRMTSALASRLETIDSMDLEDMLMEFMDDFFEDPDPLPFEFEDWVVFSPRRKNQRTFPIKPKTKGFVIQAYHEEGTSGMCDIVLEAKAYQGFAPKDWEALLETRPWLPTVSVPVEDLKLARSTFDLEASVATGRELMNAYLLKNRHFSKDAQALLPKVLSTSPTRSDTDNWKHYFEQFPLPKGIEVEVLPSPWPYLPEGSRVKIVDVAGFDLEDGLLVTVKMGRRRPIPFPMHYLVVLQGPKDGVGILSVYKEWEEHRMPGDSDYSWEF